MKIHDIIITEANKDNAGQQCAKFSPAAKACNPGCKSLHIKAGEHCPYSIKEQYKCPCFA